MICDTFDVIEVPFPFTDKPIVKTRPAAILSNKKFNSSTGCSIMIMITSAAKSAWLFDIEIQDIEPTGLHHSGKIRMKIFTLDNRLIIRKHGKLSSKDSKILKTKLINEVLL